MPTKTITLEIDAYEQLAKARRDKESFSQVVRRVFKDFPDGIVPALTAAELEEALKPFEGIGAGPKHKSRDKPRRHAAA